MKRIKDEINAYQLVDNNWLLYVYDEADRVLYVTVNDKHLLDEYVKYGVKETGVNKMISKIENWFKKQGIGIVDIDTTDPRYFAIFDLGSVRNFNIEKLEYFLEGEDERFYDWLGLDYVQYPEEAYEPSDEDFSREIDITKDTAEKPIHYIWAGRTPRTKELSAERDRILGSVEKQGKMFCSTQLKALAAIEIHGNSFVFFNSPSLDTEVYFTSLGKKYSSLAGVWSKGDIEIADTFDFYSAIRFTDGSAFAVSKKEYEDFLNRYDTEDEEVLDALIDEILQR